MSTVSRREAVQRILTAAAAPILASCGADRLLNPQLFTAGSVGPVSLIGGGDQHSTGTNQSHRTGEIIKGMLDRDPTAWAFANGDLVPTGTEQEYAQGYDVAWGSFLSRTFTTMGNHDIIADPSGNNYFDYVGNRGGPRGKGYYAVTLGAWRCYFLNSQMVRAEQAAWLAADLPHWENYHIMAMWHIPHFASPCEHTGGKSMAWPGDNGTGQFWQALQDHRAEFVIGGHVHRWERFPRMIRNSSKPEQGTLSSQGIRQFVVGTGGVVPMPPFAQRHPYVERIVPVRGVAKFTLRSDRYEWKFTDLDGTVRDSGIQMCRKVPA